MELYASLLSPVWWSSVLLCSAMFGVLSSLIHRHQAHHRAPAKPIDDAESNRRMGKALRLRLWVVNLLVAANVGMLAGLSAVNLRTPALYGPVSLAFVLLCLVSLTLSVSVYMASVRLGSKASGQAQRRSENVSRGC